MKLHYIMLALLPAALLAACNDDDTYFEEDAQSTPMSVNAVYLENHKSAVPDRLVEFARVGQTLRLEGSGFYGVRRVEINGYETYFNRAYVSDKSMVVSIHSKTPISDCPADLRNTIRLIKDKTETTYSFTIRSGYSVIESISCTLPQPGEKVTVYGDNLHETSAVTLPGGIIVTDIENDPDGEWYSFIMPDGVTEGGAIISESPNGITQSAPYFNQKAGLILDFDNADNGNQGSWGGKDDDGNIKPNSSMVYPEDLVEDPLGSGRGLCLPVVPQRLIDGGFATSGKSRISECWTAGAGDALDDWSRFTASYIPAETPVTEVAFQFDVLIDAPWSGTGHIQLSLINNYNIAGIGSDDDGKNNMVAFYVPWLSKGVDGGEVIPYDTDGRWVTVTIPFSSFNKYATMVADPETATPAFQLVIDDRAAAKYPNFGMGFVNTDFSYTALDGKSVKVESVAVNGPGIFTDNWRIVPCKPFVPSDYPEDDEK